VAGEVVGVFSLLNWYRAFGIDLLGTPRFKDMAIDGNSLLFFDADGGTKTRHHFTASRLGAERRCQISTNIDHVHIVVGLKIVRICVGITFQIVIAYICIFYLLVVV